MQNDPFDLERFVTAQASIYPQALAELAAGYKRSHWMWFIFPQIEGLGHSAMAERYAIHDRSEAKAYLAHPLLGDRLIECTEAVFRHAGDKSAHEIFGSPDDMKFRSCLTLFAAASKKGSPFERALQAFYNGEPDPKTIEQLAQ